jgi:hypothetical protein
MAQALSAHPVRLALGATKGQGLPSLHPRAAILGRCYIQLSPCTVLDLIFFNQAIEMSDDTRKIGHTQ